MSSALSAERAEGDDDTPPSEFLHQIVFLDHTQGEDLTINPHFILRMRVQRNEAAWAEIRFESKIQSTQIYKARLPMSLHLFFSKKPLRNEGSNTPLTMEHYCTLRQMIILGDLLNL